MGIYKTEVFMDDFNRTVTVKTNIEDNSCNYVGAVLIRTEKGNIPIEFQFEGENLSILNCFETFDDTLKSYIKKKQEEQSKIITPENAGEIITP